MHSIKRPRARPLSIRRSYRGYAVGQRLIYTESAEHEALLCQGADPFPPSSRSNHGLAGRAATALEHTHGRVTNTEAMPHLGPAPHVAVNHPAGVVSLNGVVGKHRAFISPAVAGALIVAVGKARPSTTTGVVPFGPPSARFFEALTTCPKDAANQLPLRQSTREPAGPPKATPMSVYAG